MEQTQEYKQINEACIEAVERLEAKEKVLKAEEIKLLANKYADKNRDSYAIYDRFVDEE